MQTLQDIGSALKQVRLKQKLTQRDIQERTGMSQQHYQRAEAGNDIRLSSLLKILDGLGLTLMLVPDRDVMDVTAIIAPETVKRFSLLDTMKDLED